MNEDPNSPAFWEPPERLAKYAEEVERWFNYRGVRYWQYRGICSRNYADMVEEILRTSADAQDGWKWK